MSSKQAASSAFSFERINRAPTNQSTTKQTFSFSKSSRFYEPKPE